MYRVAVIGCGKGGEGVGAHSIGHAHGRHWSRCDYAKIVGACDLNAENLASYVKNFEVEFASDSAADMLARAKPDIVSICTYAGSHADLVEALREVRGQGRLLRKTDGAQRVGIGSDRDCL
ncbi:Gfo/Idh/MocA family oxidoreductase [Devosia algicola]|uniref:Gfo/Idh/MocA family oxidoreductase n=1 Tax=Devosia algicola TaxID=3026418 RepID=UPI003898F716